jgi:hypothetical protein
VAEAPAQHPPTPAELLRAALEKIVFFEWRLSELAAELSAAQSRCASAELERARADDQARAAHEQAKAARMQLADLEAERARLASLLSRPRGPIADTQALDAERDRAARLQAELDDARRQLQHGRSERERWLSEMIEQSRAGGEEPAALAQFISELRGEVIALRDRQQRCDALLAKAGIALPLAAATPVIPVPMRESEPVEEARKLWAEGRLASAAPAISAPKDAGAAARALADQCGRNLSSGDPARREQAARHLLAVPIPSAAPLLANALAAEKDAKARAQMARALAACGGEGAADIVAQLQAISEPPLVRLAAVEALCGVSSRARAALETAAQDPAAGVRRRAAALAAAEGLADLLARFSADPDPSVRAAAEAACREAPEPAAEPVRDIAGEALLAVQSAIFGLSEAELGERLGLPEQEAASIASRLLSSRRIGRRGKRLVAAEGA